MDSSFIQARIDAIKIQIVAYETALTALATTQKSYTINTGQTTETVTRHDAARVQETIEALISMLQYWESLLDGTNGTMYARPGF